MPVIESRYTPPLCFSNPHLQTIYPALFRRCETPLFVRERLETADEDFLDIDWVRGGAAKLMVMSHGLEGSARSTYMRGMIHAVQEAGYDVAAWNYRSCSGEPNRKLSSYHSGASCDLDAVLSHILRSTDYREICLIGFSIGGNITLKYLGEKGHRVDSRLRAAAVISVPCDLEDSANALALPKHRVYMNHFLKPLRRKIRQKAALFPGALDLRGLDDIRTFHEFDGRYTAPLHGFADAHDYWKKSSSINFIPEVKLPTLILNAADDPFLGASCMPQKEAEGNSCVTLEIPSHGGHVGFVHFFDRGRYFSESRALSFLTLHSSPESNV